MVNPTGYTALDLIGFTDKGDYVNNANYVKNDLVSYLGSIWRCLIDDTTGIAPAEGVNWTLFMAQPSSNVEQIIAPVEQATATEAIAIGDQFIYNDILYEATAAISQGGNIIIPPNAGANCKVSDTLVKQIKTIKSSLGTAATKDVPLSGNASNTQVVLGNDSRLSDSRTPTSHASNATTYGAGNASNFGHVKLSDTFGSDIGAASDGIGASQSALYNAYTKSHAAWVNIWSGTATKTGTSDLEILTSTSIPKGIYLIATSLKISNSSGQAKPAWLTVKSKDTTETSNLHTIFANTDYNDDSFVDVVVVNTATRFSMIVNFNGMSSDYYRMFIIQLSSN